jgi:hypothetical protein
MLWAPVYTLLPFCIVLAAWLLVMWDPMSLADFVGFFAIALAAYAFLAFVCMGIAGVFSYRFLSRRHAFELGPTVVLAAGVGVVATLPFVSMWDLGIWLVGLITGAVTGFWFRVLARRFSVRDA